MGFCEEALGITDKLLSMTQQKINDKHPLAQLFFETAMSLREILCCWEASGLHHVAYEHLVKRNFKSKLELNRLSQNVRSPMESHLYKFSAAVGQGWQKRWFCIYNHHMTFHKSKGGPPHKALDLTQYTEVKEAFNGLEAPEFMVNARAKLYKFKAATDRERCMWVKCIESYQRRREINATLHSYPVSQKLKIFTEQIHTRETPKEKQYLFSTKDPNKSASQEEDKHEAKDPFMASMKTMSKPKPRKLEFQFNGNKKKLLITKDDEDTPYIVLTQADVMDFKFIDKKLLLKLSLQDGGQHRTKEFKFPSESEFTRFKKVLNMFRHYSNAFLFYHMDALNRFKRLSEDEIQKILGSRDHITTDTENMHASGDEIEKLPPPSPSADSYREMEKPHDKGSKHGRNNSDPSVNQSLSNPGKYGMTGKHGHNSPLSSKSSPNLPSTFRSSNSSPPPPVPSKSKKPPVPSKSKKPKSPILPRGPPGGQGKGLSPPRRSPPSGGRGRGLPPKGKGLPPGSKGASPVGSRKPPPRPPKGRV